MKKLTINSPVGDFYDRAHYLLLTKGRFAMNQIYDDMLEQCDDSVSFNFIKPIVLEELDGLLNSGLIIYIDEGVGVYESTLTENVEQSI